MKLKDILSLNISEELKEVARDWFNARAKVQKNKNKDEMEFVINKKVLSESEVIARLEELYSERELRKTIKTSGFSKNEISEILTFIKARKNETNLELPALLKHMKKGIAKRMTEYWRQVEEED